MIVCRSGTVAHGQELTGRNDIIFPRAPHLTDVASLKSHYAWPMQFVISELASVGDPIPPLDFIVVCIAHLLIFESALVLDTVIEVSTLTPLVVFKSAIEPDFVFLVHKFSFLHLATLEDAVELHSIRVDKPASPMQLIGFVDLPRVAGAIVVRYLS